MAIDLENGMFALHIQRKAPPAPKVNGFAGTGTYADPYVLTLDGVPVPDADLTSEVERDILWNGILAGSSKYSKFMLCAAMTVPRIHSMSILDSDGQLDIRPAMQLAPQGEGASYTDIRTEDIMSLTEAASYAALSEGGNYASDATIKSTTYTPTRKPFVGVASVPFVAGKLIAAAQNVISIKQMLSMDFLASAESTGIGASVIDMKLDFIGDNPEHSYTMLHITKNAASNIFQGTIQYGPEAGAETEDYTIISSPISPETGSVQNSFVGCSIRPLSSAPKISATANDPNTLDIAKKLFPGTGRLSYSMNYTGSKATQAYLCPVSVSLTARFNR